jgi:hypothetical protein
MAMPAVIALSMRGECSAARSRLRERARPRWKIMKTHAKR